MQRAWTPPARWVAGVIAFLAVSSTLQAWRLDALSSKMALTSGDLGRLFLLNLAYWAVPACCIPTIVAIASRFRFDTGRKVTAFAVHLVSAVVFALVRQVAALGWMFAEWMSKGKPSVLGAISGASTVCFSTRT